VLRITRHESLGPARRSSRICPRPLLVSAEKRSVSAQWNGPNCWSCPRRARARARATIWLSAVARGDARESALDCAGSARSVKCYRSALLAGVGQHLAGRGALAGALFALAPARENRRRRPQAPTRGDHGAMRESLNGHRARYAVLPAAGRPCPRCGNPMSHARRPTPPAPPIGARLSGRLRAR